MILRLNDGESVTIQCNHVDDPDKAHSFTFSNHGGELVGREFNMAREKMECVDFRDHHFESDGGDCIYCGKTYTEIMEEK